MIAIIALLVSILLPSLQRAKELTKRAICSTSLRGLANSLAMYAAEYNGFFPAFNDGTPVAGHDSVGKGFTTPDPLPTGGGGPPGGVAGSSRSYFKLVKLKLASVANFQCPSDGSALSDEEITGVADNQYDFDPDCGFGEAKYPVSYSFQIAKANFNGMYRNVGVTHSADKGTKVMMADFSPLLNRDRDDSDSFWVTSGNDNDMSVAKNLNSKNHGGGGQNVMFKAGHALWVDNPFVGAEIDDNDFKDCIWTVDSDDDPPEHGDQTLGARSWPASKKDTVLR